MSSGYPVSGSMIAFVGPRNQQKQSNPRTSKFQPSRVVPLLIDSPPQKMVEESLREEWGYQPAIKREQIGQTKFIPVDALISSHNSGLLLQTLASRLFTGDHPRLLVKVIDSGKENIKACPKLKFEQPISIKNSCFHQIDILSIPKFGSNKNHQSVLDVHRKKQLPPPPLG